MSTTKKGYLNIVYISVAVLTIAAMIICTVVLSGSKKASGDGVIKPEDLNDVKIAYSAATESMFKRSLETFMYNILNVSDRVPFNMDYLGADIILHAMRNAKIGGDKVESISIYLKNAKPSEFPLSDFIIEIVDFTYIYDENGDICFDEDGDAMLESVHLKEDADIIGALLKSVDPIALIADLVANTALTTYDIGSFFYEHQLLISQGQRKDLIVSLGKDNYIALFIDSFEIFTLINEFMAIEEISLSEARMLREIVYEKGSRFLHIVDVYGVQNLETLLGIGSDILKIDSNTSFTENEIYVAQNINEASKQMQGLTGYMLGTLGQLMTNLPLSTFESLVIYKNEDDGFAYTHVLLSIIKQFKLASDTAINDYSLTKDAVIDKLSGMSAHLIMIEKTDKNLDLNEQIASEKQGLIRLFDLLDQIYSSDINTLDDIKALSQQDYQSLLDDIDDFFAAFERLKMGIIRAESMIIYGLLAGLVEY